MAKFTFAAITSFWAPVTVVTPGGEEQVFEGQFIYLDDKAWADKGTMPTLDFLRTHWTGWRGIDDGTGNAEVPYSEAQREILLGHTFVTQAVINAYIAARTGQRAKN